MLLATDVNLAQSQSIFDPASPAAHSIVSLAILVLAVAGLIFVIVEGVLIYCVWRFRADADSSAPEPPQAYGSRAIEIAWTAAPTLIVLFLVLAITRTLWEVEVDPPKPMPDDRALFITVTGRQWWWEYTYETYDNRPLGFTTANELHIPAGEPGHPRPVYLKLVAADVCHSFWVPRLAGKMDLIPGRANHLTLETDTPGLYQGQCAEYCGTQHAHMLLRVVVEEPAAFDRWLQEQAQPAVDDPALTADRDAFLAQSCVNCHRVRGTPADGSYAPDLTHLMSRRTLASGMVENTPENLDRWVADPQSIKPGCLMPAFGLGSEDQAAIVRYLQTLR
ncbi:MAG: cytochrome c oxidase subunit II [Pirellulales bacterium]